MHKVGLHNLYGYHCRWYSSNYKSYDEEQRTHYPVERYHFPTVLKEEKCREDECLQELYFIIKCQGYDDGSNGASNKAKYKAYIRNCQGDRHWYNGGYASDDDQSYLGFVCLFVLKK